MRTNADKKKVVTLLDKETGTIMSFTSRTEMGKQLGVGVITLYKFLREDETCRLNKRYKIINK